MEYVHVRRHASDWRIATYRLEDLEGVHWDIISGGVQRREPFHGFLHMFGAIK